MSTPFDPEHFDPEILKQAIEQLRQELPDLLDTDYLSFSRKLQSLLSSGSNSELLALFASYPVAYDRLQNILNHFTAGYGLYGDSISDKSSNRYICPVGPHNVEDYQKKDVVGRPLCPVHHKPMKPAV